MLLEVYEIKYNYPFTSNERKDYLFFESKNPYFSSANYLGGFESLNKVVITLEGLDFSINQKDIVYTLKEFEKIIKQRLKFYSQFRSSRNGGLKLETLDIGLQNSKNLISNSLWTIRIDIWNKYNIEFWRNLFKEDIIFKIQNSNNEILAYVSDIYTEVNTNTNETKIIYKIELRKLI